MRIAFMGKGGAGKTSMSALYSLFVSQRQDVTLLIDADVNCHLGQTLGFKSQISYIGEDFDRIALEPLSRFSKLGLTNVPRFGTIPPTGDSTFIRIGRDSAVLKQFGLFEGPFCLLAVGPNSDQDLGLTCYHSKINSLEIILHHLIDSDNQRVVIDSTAGTDPLSTSLAYASDMHLLVVEPTRKSLNVFVDYVNMCGPIASRVFVIANKIQDSEDMDFIRSVIPSDRFLGMLPLSEKVRRAEQGQRQEFSGFVSENEALWVRCISQVRLAGRNEQEEIAAVNKLYISACKKWASEFYKKDLTLLAELRQDCLFNSEVV